jgi:hypothetical protein
MTSLEGTERKSEMKTLIQRDELDLLMMIIGILLRDKPSYH